VIRRLGLACAAALFLTAPTAKAEIITSLFNTGVSNTGTRLGGGLVDPHWTISTNPSGTGSAAYTTVANGFPLPGPWLSNPTGAAWIQPTSGTTDNHAAGTYVYSTNFDLTGFDPTTATVSFRVAADDRISGVYLNGNNVGFTYNGVNGGAAYASLSDQFTISNPAFFQDGLNQLQFHVVNDPVAGDDCYDPTNPTGMLVKVYGKACPIPEPSTFALVGAGLGIFAFRRLRKKTS
jgi:hypothetical protein